MFLPYNAKLICKLRVKFMLPEQVKRNNACPVPTTIANVYDLHIFSTTPSI